MLTLIIIIAIAYLAGSINFPIILFKLTGRADPRQQFSGNPGTTNVYRQAGPAWAVVVLLLDFSRAMGVAWLALYLLPAQVVPWVGLALVLGNRLPCFHGFQGGKGVANYLGFFALVTGVEVLFSLAAWLVAFGLFRKPFIASFFLILVLGGFVSHNLAHHPVAVAGMGVTILFVIYNHKRNILELVRN